MLVRHEREKLIQAIVFFAMRTRKFGKIKLFKLLYFLDFEHFKLTGRSVTGLDYNAWKMGPVPVALFEEIKSPQPDLAEAVAFTERDVGGEFAMLAMAPRVDFDPKHFSRRELKIMNELVERYYDTPAGRMIEDTHLENLPWHKVWEQQGDRQAPIPYDLALRPDEADLMRLVASDREELLERIG